MASAGEVTLRRLTRNGADEWLFKQQTEQALTASGTVSGTAAELKALAIDLANALGEPTLATAIGTLTVADITLSSTLIKSSIKPAKTGVPPNDPSFFVEVETKPASGSNVVSRFCAVGPDTGTSAQKSVIAARNAVAAWAHFVGHTPFALDIKGLTP